MGMEQSTNGWNEYRRQVLREFEVLHERIDVLDQKLDKLGEKHTQVKEALVMLQTRAAVWGTIAGFGATILLSFILKILKLQ